MAKDYFNELKATPDWNKDANIIFEEEKNIEQLGKQIAKIYSTRHDKYEAFDDLKEFVNMVFRDKSVAGYVYDETIRSLKEDYNICPSDINI